MAGRILHVEKTRGFFNENMEHFLEEDGESCESYVTNIFRGDSWGDTTIAAAVGRMFNLTATLVTPSYYKPQHMMHELTNDPHIVIVANSGNPTSAMPCSHFSATEKTEEIPSCLTRYQPETQEINSKSVKLGRNENIVR